MSHDLTFSLPQGVGPQAEDDKHKAIIVDIDGTLSDCDHRRHHVEGDNKDWAAFNGAMEGDKIQPWCKTMISAFQYELIKVILVTGREETYRKITEEWLEANGLYQRGKPIEGVRFEDVIEYEGLLMRRARDYRQDAVIKEEILKSKILPKFNVVFAVDDRRQVVDMWRRNGITCLHCAEGEF